MATTLIKLTPIALALLLTGCGTIGNQLRSFDDPVVTKPELKVEAELPEPTTGAITVAVYNFRDMTGQRKASQTIASLSSAVTQGADAYLVKSLQEVGGGKWFKVLERGGLDNLVKERQLIRQMRELYQGKDAQPLPPMIFAGMLVEGGIIGYDSNTMSGGSGARLLGIGASTEYRQDEVTISLRAVSVATGEVLVAVNIAKTVYSFMDKAGVLRFIEAGTKSIELETGSATNESMNRAVQMAIHAAVIEMIKEGEKRGHWAYKTQPQPQPVVSKVDRPEEKKEVDKKDAPPANKEEPKVEKVILTTQSSTNLVDGSGAPILQTTYDLVRKGRVIDWVNLRVSRDHNSERLLNLKPGTEVDILETHDQHYKIKTDGRVGYVVKKLIKVQ